MMTRFIRAIAAVCMMIFIGMTSAMEPGWPMQVTGFSLAKAYPGISYEWRLAVKGGVYPYLFTLVSGPTGMTIDMRKGIISWTPDAAFPAKSVQIRITDKKGATLDHNFTIESTTAGFYFVASNGDDSNPGTLTLPWRTLAKAVAPANNGGIIYVRTGTYAASGLEAGKWIAYPGENVVWDCGGDGNINPRKDSCAFIGFEIRNSGIHMFRLDGILNRGVWRKNRMHDIQAGNSMENPAFIFSADGSQRPINGDLEYDQLVIQDNLFYDIVSTTSHAAAVTGYNMSNLLFEDNESFNINGRGVSDKDDGYQNTFRNNVLHDCDIGAGLFSQYTQAKIEVCYNLIYNCPTALVVGSQPGYIRDVFIHHNTIVNGGIEFGVITDDIQSGNFNIYNNILIGNGSGIVYGFCPVSENGAYRYQSWASDLTRTYIDSNIVWNTSAGRIVAGFDWGLTNRNFSQWQAWGYDLHSHFVNVGLTSLYTLPEASPYLGKFGRDQGNPLRVKKNHQLLTGAIPRAGSANVVCYDLQGRPLNTSTIKTMMAVITIGTGKYDKAGKIQIRH